MTRRTIGTARYGLMFHSGEMAAIHACSLIQALAYCTEKPQRVLVFERDVAAVVDEHTLNACWIKSRH